MSFWCLHFLPKTNENKSTSSKVEFVRLFFGRTVGLKKSFRICLDIHMYFLFQFYFVQKTKNFDQHKYMIVFKIKAYFKTLQPVWKYRMPQLLSMEKQGAQLLKKKIDVQSRSLWNRVNYEAKLYIPSTINIWKKVLTKAIWAVKKWAGFWQISLYIK